MQRRIFSSVVVALAVTQIVPSTARAQTLAFPTKPITIVIPVPPGGTADFVIRAVQNKLAETLGVSVVIESKSGASQQIGTNYVIQAEPDGHTLLFTVDSHVVNAVANKKLPYDALRDLTPISMFVRQPFVIGCHPSLPISNLRELIVYAKSNPRKLNFGSPGQGTLSFLVLESIKKLANIDVVHIAYKGAAPAMQAVLANEVQYNAISLGGQLPHIRSGRLKPLAVTSSHRVSALPEVPTVAEMGFPDFEAQNWMGLFSPAKVPRIVIDKLYTAINTTLSDTEIRNRLIGGGYDVTATNPEEFNRFIANEYKRWDNFAKANNIVFE